MKWLWSHTDLKINPKNQVSSYLSTSKAADNNNSKFLKICVLTSLKNDHAKLLADDVVVGYEYFFCQAFHKLRREAGAHITLLC